MKRKFIALTAMPSAARRCLPCRSLESPLPVVSLTHRPQNSFLNQTIVQRTNWMGKVSQGLFPPLLMHEIWTQETSI